MPFIHTTVKTKYNVCIIFAQNTKNYTTSGNHNINTML